MNESGLCFCGSGILKSNCHPKIHEQSKAARVIKLYKKIDKLIKKHYTDSPCSVPCSKGCHECCYTDFPMSDIEMDLIMYEVHKWEPQKIVKVFSDYIPIWNNILRKYPDYVQTLAMDGTNRKDIVLKGLSFNPHQKDFPCVFLDKKENSCLIYSVRPTICRTFGTAFYESEWEECFGASFDNICSKIGNKKTARKWQADLNELNKEINSLSHIYALPYSRGIDIRQYPMFYYVYKRYLSYGRPMVPKDFDKKFFIPEQQYIQYLFSKNTTVQNPN